MQTNLQRQRKSVVVWDEVGGTDGRDYNGQGETSEGDGNVQNLD